MTLSSKVYHHIRMLFFDQTVNGFTVRDAFFYKTEIGMIHHRCQCGEVSCVGQTIQTDNAVIRVFF